MKIKLGETYYWRHYPDPSLKPQMLLLRVVKLPADKVWRQYTRYKKCFQVVAQVVAVPDESRIKVPSWIFIENISREDLEPAGIIG